MVKNTRLIEQSCMGACKFTAINKRVKITDGIRTRFKTGSKTTTQTVAPANSAHEIAANTDRQSGGTHQREEIEENPALEMGEEHDGQEDTDLSTQDSIDDYEYEPADSVAEDSSMADK